MYKRQVIDTLFTNIVDAFYHPIGFIIFIAACYQVFLILVVDFFCNIAPFVIAVISPGFSTIIGFSGNLIQII